MSKRATNAKRRLVYDDNDMPKRSVRSNSQSAPPPEAEPSIILETPQKKRKIDSFFSPAKTAQIVTPEKEHEIETPRKQKAQPKKEQYIPVYIHKNVGYQRRGDATLTEALQKTFDLVEEYFVIPDDIETDRSFGPLSGTCFEERAVASYNKELLLPKSPEFQGLQICSQCAELGHKRNDCPHLL